MSRGRGKRGRGRKGGSGSRLLARRVKAALAGLALLLAGLLAGAFWQGWRGVQLKDGGSLTGPPATFPESANRPRVEVLNGAGDPGAAEQVAARLRERGFDVVYFGNAESFDHRRTIVLDRSGKGDAARKVAKTLGADTVLEDPKPELYLDATVVLGDDWRSLFPGGSGGADSGPPALERLRRKLSP